MIYLPGRSLLVRVYLPISPTGKSLRFIEIVVQPFKQKYFCFSETQISYILRHPVPLRGALRNVTNAGRDAVDADGAPDEGA